MKKYWKKTPPKAEGWYWCKYGKLVCPCMVHHFKTVGTVVRTAYGDFFSSDGAGFDKLKFGEEIKEPTNV